MRSTKAADVAPAGKKASTTSVSGKRKRDGVIYTPDHITRFIVEKTLNPVIVERFNSVYTQFYLDGAWRKPSKDEKTNAPPSTAPEDVTEYYFWQAWQQALTHIRVCDPACGSGAFLVAAFDLFKEAYTQLVLKLRELAPHELINMEISHEILHNNLFGVDINAESIEITKLSLWLKTAERGHQLAGLEANFYQGNSLVTDPALDPLAFDWQAHYPVVFGDKFDATNNIANEAINTPAIAENSLKNTIFNVSTSFEPGFDVILGNPPYVRQELFIALKPYLQHLPSRIRLQNLMSHPPLYPSSSEHPAHNHIHSSESS